MVASVKFIVMCYGGSMKVQDTDLYYEEEYDYNEAQKVMPTYTAQGRDELIPHVGMEVEVNGEWIPAYSELWNAWTGRRRLWNTEYHGPVYAMGGKPGVPYDGKRICSCSECQRHVKSSAKYN